MDSRQALAELQNFQKTRKSAGDYYSQYQDELGVGGAQQSANDVRGLIRNTETALRGVNASVAGRTRGNLVTEAQRARLEGLERAPIAEELGSLQGRYSDEMQNYRDLLGQATTRAGQAYQTDADRLAALESNYNKIYQAEQAAAEQARWERELAERQKQFQAEMAQRDRQFNANLANIRRQYAQPASFNLDNLAKLLANNGSGQQQDPEPINSRRYSARDILSQMNPPKVDDPWKGVQNLLSGVGKAVRSVSGWGWLPI
jgi:hypothetical protein